MTESSSGQPQLPPELAERVARRRAAMGTEAPGEPTVAGPGSSASVPATQAARRSGRQPTGKASRLAVAGGAIGLGFGLVGVMAAAATPDGGTPAAVVQRVVVPQAPVASQPAQVIVMLPSASGVPATTIDVPAVVGKAAIPDVPASPAPAVVASAPVAESHGS